MTKKQCVAANAEGQALRLDGKLGAARVELEKCGDPRCPAIVRDDCAQRLDEIERAQPSIVFDVKDASGADVSAVSVTIDGRPAADRLTGTALRVDPGEHVFVFTSSIGPAITRTFVLKEGEKERRERIALASPASAASAFQSSGPARGTAPAAEPSTMSKQRVLGLAAGGVGIIGVAVGGVLGLMTFSASSQAKNDCESSSSCANHALALSEHGAAATYGTGSTVAFIGGGVLIAVGAALFFTSPRSSTPVTTGRLSASSPWIPVMSIAPTVGPRVGGASLVARF
jgi:hypothetical protein